MSSLPDRKRPRLTLPARKLATSLIRMAGHGTWRVLHPATRGSFVEAPRPAPLERLYYEAGDGWRAPVWRVPPIPGAAGEPVLVAHGLGLTADALRYGTDPTLVAALRAAGFSVYLLAHRGDGEAIPPHGSARSEVRFEAILERDLPAASERVVLDAGMDRLHFVGHGLGGQLGLCWATSRPDALASVVAIAAPMRLAPESRSRRARRALALLPARWRLPLRAACRLAAPFLDDELPGALSGLDQAPGGRVRGALTYATDDVPVGLMRQILSWQDHGGPVSAGGALDWTEALVDARVPLLAVCGSQDEVCPPPAARPAVDSWGAEAEFLEVAGCGHHDLLLGSEADQAVFQPIVEWLVGHRKRSWLDASTIDARLSLETPTWPQAANASPATS